MKLSEIAKSINGELTGDDIDVTGVSNLDVQKENTIAYAESPKNLKKLIDTIVPALIIKPNMDCPNKSVIKVENPKSAFSKVLAIFSPYKPYPKKIYPNVYIEESAVIGENVTIMPFTSVMDNSTIGNDTILYSNVFIGKNVSVGKNCVIKSGVKIDDHTVIGDNVVIHHNAVIGGDGFGFTQEDGRNVKIPQIGHIIVGNDVEIGACVTIDRATIGETSIGENVIIDNLVQIAHNVKIGDHSIIVSQVGIAGSTTLGKNCILAGQVGVADHIEIGNNVVVLSKSGVEHRKIEDNKVLMGIPARDVMLQRRIFASMERLPELIKTVRDMKKGK